MTQPSGERGGFVPQTQLLDREKPTLMISNVYPIMPQADVEGNFGVRGYDMLAEVILPGHTMEGINHTSLFVMHAVQAAASLRHSTVNRSPEAPDTEIAPPHTYSIIDKPSLGILAHLSRLSAEDYADALERGALDEVRVAAATPTSWQPDCAVIIGGKAEFATILHDNPYISGQHTGFAFGDATVTVSDLSRNGTQVVYHPEAEIAQQSAS